MKFDPALGHRILAGGKTTHRLPATRSRECPHQPGDIEPLHFPETMLDSYDQPILDNHGQPRKTVTHDGRLRITAVTRQARLDDLTDQQARDEGHRTVWAFFDWWAQQHHERAWLTDDELAQPVWVVVFRVEYADTSRYLQRVHGYTSSRHRAIDDLPVLSSARDERAASELADRKRREQAEANRLAREQLSLEQRIVAARSTAEVKGLRLVEERRLLERHLRAGDRRAAVRAVRSIEGAVWPEERAA